MKKSKKTRVNLAQKPNVVYTGKREISRIDDSFAKYLLSFKGHEDLLLNFVNSVMRNKKQIEFASVEVKNPFNLKESQLEQETIMDIKAVTNSNETILLEVQVKGSEIYFDRVVDYVMRNGKVTEEVLLPKNKIKKEKLLLRNPKQVVSINLLGFTLYEEFELAHTMHKIHCCETGSVSSEKISLHMLDLTKGVETIEDKELKQWFGFFYSENFEQEKNMIAQQSPIMKKAVSAYNTFVSSDDCMSYAEKHQLYKMYQEWEAQAREEKAEKRGIEKGIEKGAHNEKIATAKKLLTMGLSIKQVVQGTGLTEKEVL